MGKPEFDSRWVAAAKTGDQDALTALYESTCQHTYATIRSVIRTDEDTACDLLQETYIKAFQRLDSLAVPEKFPAWVRQIANHAALDHVKKSKPVLFSELSDGDGEDVDFEPVDPNIYSLPEAAMDQKETVRLLREILDGLPEGQRAVISMYYYQDMSVKEIAELLGRSEGTVKAQLYNGRKNIESKVRELEKKDGIKLYSLAPVPFVLFLLSGCAPAESAQSAAVLEGVLQAVGTTSGTAASGTTAVSSGTTVRSAASGAATAASSAGSALVGKIIAGVLAGVVALGGIGMGISKFQENLTATAPTGEQMETAIHTQCTRPETMPEQEYSMPAATATDIPVATDPAAPSGVLWLYAKYDDYMEPCESDIFEIHYINDDTGKTGSITIDASTIAGSMKDYHLEVGIYTVTKITYLGTSDMIVNDVYGTMNCFRIYDDDTDELLFICIGASEVRALKADYANAIIVEPSDTHDSYETVLEQYRDVLSMDADAFDAWNTSEDGFNAGHVAIFYHHTYGSDHFYYAYYDIDDNGTDEMLIATGDDQNKRIVDVYGFDGVRAVQLVDEPTLGDRSQLYIFDDGIDGIFDYSVLHIRGSNSASETSRNFYRLDGTSLIALDIAMNCDTVLHQYPADRFAWTEIE